MTSKPTRVSPATLARGLGVLGLACAAGCFDGTPPAVASQVELVQGAVHTTWGAAVVGATVYLVPATAVPTSAITGAQILDGSAEDRDEPLEDALRGAAASTFPRATTGSDGSFVLAALDTSTGYFPFVDVSGATPSGLLPGGSLSRAVRQGIALRDMAIEVTGQPPSGATYVGSSTCLICHGAMATFKTHAHRLGFRVPGESRVLQSLSRQPGFDNGLAFFKIASSSTAKSVGTSLWFSGYDASRGFDKFAVSTTDPGGAEIRIYLWRDGTGGDYRVTMENLVNTGDPDRTYTVALTYGGALHKQRYALAVPGYNGRYLFLQYQHEGNNAYYDRTRRVWRDFHMDRFWDATSKLFMLPPKTATLESNCMACHTTGYRYFDDGTTGERLCDGVDDPAGVFDIDGDGKVDEINVGCETCHGPGSDHVAAVDPRYIVSPAALSPSREAMICGRCHDRWAGNDDRMNDQPLNASGEMAPPGISRADFLASYVSRKGPATSSLWDDGVHSKAHRQHYADYLKSAHARNARRLVVCSDCHDSHGQGGYDGDLPDNPSDGTLCAHCHVVDLAAHLVAKTGSSKSGASPTCLSCHFYRTAKSGAGRYGLLLGTPTGAASDANIVYWENDIHSHLTAVPRKTNSGVAGKVPGDAMPVPYTNACASCHDATALLRIR